jgi:hypothetical protein
MKKATVTALLLNLCACGSPSGDPLYPSPSGTVTLGATAAPATSKCLNLELFDGPQGAVNPTDFGSDDTHFGQRLPLEGVAFPFAYHLTGEIGTSRSLDLRLLAWLSTDCSASARPKSGEAYGVVDFKAPLCSLCSPQAPCGCGTIQGVDVSIDQTVP